jgi:hypothetical protein
MITSKHLKYSGPYKKLDNSPLLGIIMLSSFHMAKIGVSVVSRSASFIMIVFCKREGVDDKGDLEGGPSGGNGDVDNDAAVGLVNADDIGSSWFGLRLELVDDGLECELDLEWPSEQEVETRVTCRDCP